MSVFNGEKHLSKAIESILDQTFCDFEFIIIDDASMDSSRDIIQTFARKDTRIRLIENHTNLGLAASLNIGIQQARGDFIARMDADDISLERRFEKQIVVLRNNPDIYVLGTFVKVIDENGHYIRKFDVPYNPIEIFWNIVTGFKPAFIHPTVLIKKDFFAQIGLYNEDFRAGQDYELWSRLIISNYKPNCVGNLPESLLLYRAHGQSKSILERRTQIENGDLIRKKIFETFCETEPKGFQRTDSTSNNADEYITAYRLLLKKFIEKYKGTNREMRNLEYFMWEHVSKKITLKSLFFETGQSKTSHFSPTWARQGSSIGLLQATSIVLHKLNRKLAKNS